MPAARQLLITHIGGEIEKGTVNTLLSKVNLVGGGLISPSTFSTTILNILDSLQFYRTADIRANFVQTMNALGYPKRTKNLAISCGNGVGACQGFGNSTSMFSFGVTVDPTITQQLGIPPPCGAGNPAQLDIFAQNSAFAPSIPAWIANSYQGNLSCVTFASGSLSNALFRGWLPTDYDPVLGFNLPSELLGFSVTGSTSFLNLDNASGCARFDLSSATNSLTSIATSLSGTPGVSISTTSITNGQTFMPTWSLLDLNDKTQCINISAATVSTPFDNIWFVETPGVNLRHVQLEPDMVQFIFANAISSPLAAQQQTIASGQTLNYGAKTDWVTKKTVEANGVLAVNIPGTTVDGTVANQSEFRAYLTDACTAPKNVEIQENGLLRLGSAAANKKGHLVVTDGTNVRLKSSGKLLIENGSSLTVNLGGSLTIDAGAIIDLPSQNSKIIIRGELIVNGEFNFTGQGCFQFEQGNTITLGNGNTTFKLVGQSRANRFIRIEQSAELALKAGENIELKNGTIEAIGRIELPDANSANFTNLIFDGMDYDEIIHAVSPTSFRMDQSVVKNCFECIGIENVKSTNFRNTDFENYYGRAVWMTNSNAGGANFYNVKFDAAPNLISNAVDADGVRLLNFKDCQFKNNLSGQTGNDPATKSSAIKLANAHWCILKNSKIKDSDIGISNLDAEKPSQIYLYECAEIKNCQWGIFSNGQNFDGGPLPPTGNVGMVLMDGAKLLGNKTGIEGSNILLQLEASVGEGCGSNNEFIKPYHPAPTFYKYFVICYDGNPGSLSMLFNYWGEYVPCAVAYGCINEITTPTDHMNIRQSFCSSVVPVDAVFQMPLEFSHCGPNIDCWYELSGGVQDRNPEEEKGYGSCTFGLETTEVETVESRFRQAYFEFLSENYEAAEALFQPLADLAYSEGFQESSDCRSLVRIARAMTDHGEGVGSRNFKMAIAPTSGFSIQPNPAQDFIEIKGVLPEPFEYRIMHSLGKTVKKGAQLDSKIRLEGIDAGFFWIEIEQAGVLKSLPLFIVR